ncbi:MAG: glutamate-5-semialdehyde dehydrogenase [Salinispira sp.]
MNTQKIAEKAQSTGKILRGLNEKDKNAALTAIMKGLRTHAGDIFAANTKDLERGENLSAPLKKRLKFQEVKLNETLAGIAALIDIPDPIGEILSARELSPGLNLYQVRCPIGLIAMIFESRPDAAVQMSCLALKSGNSILLKGGSEARESVKILTTIIHDSAVSAGFPAGWLGRFERREEIADILNLDHIIDLIIPRGSNEFIRYIMDNSRIPVLGHADGICHLFIDDDADVNMAHTLIIDSKTQYTAVCNALETLLIHRDIAPQLLPELAERLQKKSVELRGCKRSRAILPNITPATEDDWSTEYLDTILSIKIVDSLQEAAAHINCYGSGHTDGIVGNNSDHAAQFMKMVDTANAFWNCSTRFSDGFRYGLGAEVGISTQKIHARGPVGMEGLTTYQWQLIGSGNYVAAGETFTHKNIDPAQYPFAQRN